MESKLEDIGFYTLSDNRAKNSSEKSDLKRCEIVLTDKCNFKCPYCRGPIKELEGETEFKEASYVIDIWIKNNLESIRFSGGEPTQYPFLDLLVKQSKRGGIKNIAISTNGSACVEYYKYLIRCGVNDFSISLDACCSSTGKTMCGGIEGMWEIVVDNIREISKLCYTTVGIVFTEDNINEVKNTIEFASSLGVSDIRIISSSQFNGFCNTLNKIPTEIRKKHPILDYRIKNFLSNRNVRGIGKNDCHKCYLSLDDMAVLKGLHFPCIIYMREHGNPIGVVDENIRAERKDWFDRHNTYKDKICRENCLDVCIDYNNKANNGKI